MSTEITTRTQHITAVSLCAAVTLGACGTTIDDGTAVAPGTTGGTPASSSASTTTTSTTTTTTIPEPARTGTFDGTLADGATWTIEVPDEWNGTLLLFSHGLVPPGEDNPAAVAPDPMTREFLHSQGFALAGSSYATTGYAVEDAIDDQLALLDVFADQVATPTRTVAWGNSLGVLATLLDVPVELVRVSEPFAGIAVRSRARSSRRRPPRRVGFTGPDAARTRRRSTTASRAAPPTHPAPIRQMSLMATPNSGTATAARRGVGR